MRPAEPRGKGLWGGWGGHPSLWIPREAPRAVSVTPVRGNQEEGGWWQAQEGAVGPRRVAKPLAEAPGGLCSAGRAEVHAAGTLPSLPGLLHRRHRRRGSPASLSRRLPGRASAVPDLWRMLLGISCLLQAIPALPLRLHGKHFVDLITR